MDRKAWIVLIVCGVLLALNMQQMQKAARERQKQQELAPATVPEETGNEEAPPAEGGKPSALVVEEQIVSLATEEVIFAFTTHGGGIKHAEFRNQKAVGEESKLVRFNEFGSAPIGALATGPDRFLDLVFELEKDKTNARQVSFRGKTKEGLWIRKEWSLLEGEVSGKPYRLNLVISFQNAGEKTVHLEELAIFTGESNILWEGERPELSGFFYLENGNFESKKASWFKKGKRGPYLKQVGHLGYAGVGGQFFASVVSPREPYDAAIWAASSPIRLSDAADAKESRTLRLAMSLPAESLAAGGDKEAVSFEVFIGPKRNPMLRSLGGKRGKVMNYGVFGIVSWPLNFLLNWLHDFVFGPVSGTWAWGWSIVALTIVIRGAMWPLQNKSTRAMKRMAKLQPEIQNLKEKYPDDPNKMNQEMMKMYREYGINPVGGCLPLVVQIPIFFGFYRMLQFAVELRGAEFLWVADLSQPDTVATLPVALPFLGDGVNLLPILMAATMVLQMMMTPKTGDKMQRRLFMMMPVIFFFFCYNFASALALYWTTSNIFAIAQTLITKRLPEPELKKKAKGKKGFWQRMQDRAEEAQKAQKARQAGATGTPQKKPKKRRPRTGG